MLLGGWAGLARTTLDTSTDEGKRLHAWAEENVFEIQSCPHDWLFPQCSAVKARGNGRYLGMVGSAKLTAESIAAGIEEVTTDQSIIAIARAISVQVQSEGGAEDAISFIDKMATSFLYPWPIKNEP